jgi:hypothetical protein
VVFRPNIGCSAELARYEAWFTDMAHAGDQLLSWGVWGSRFAQRGPRKIQYRIDVCKTEKKLVAVPPAHDGWNFVCRHDDLFVYKAEGDEVTEFAIDPRQRFESLRHQLDHVRLLGGLLCLLALLPLIFGVVTFSWETMVTGGWGYFLTAALLLACALFYWLEARRLRRIRYLYKTRQEHALPNWQSARRFSLTGAAVCAGLFVLLTGSLIGQAASAKTVTLLPNPSDTHAALPWLESIDSAVMHRVVQQDYGVDYDGNNFLAQKWSLLARSVASRQVGENLAQTYRPVLENKAYQCVNNALAERLFDEVSLPAAGWETMFATNRDADARQVRLFTTAEGDLFLAARKGPVVLTMKYTGNASNADKMLLAASAVLG